MAYNASNEERDTLVSLKKGNRGDMVIANKITNKNTGSVSVDIRQYYTNDEGEVLPTSKGVRFNSENLKEFIKGLVQALESDEVLDLADELSEMTDEDYIDEEEDDLK